MNERALGRLERIACRGNADGVYDALRGFSLRDVGELLLGVADAYPALRGVLPRMPPAEVQISWTGASDAVLLSQSLAFAGAVGEAFESVTGRAVSGARILDYGCGWGRIIRLMYKFSPPDRIYGCDAWQASLDLCKEYGVRGRLARCDEVPRGLPFEAVKFDLIYALSIFTHLSERTATAVSTTMRKYIAPDGLLVVTIRPPEYWSFHGQQHGGVDVARMTREHALRGFAFTPHNRAPIDGDITFGDTSMSIDYIKQNWTGWSLVENSIDPIDPFQERVILRPA